MPAPLLAVESLTVRYGRARVALSGASLAVDEGSTTVVLGGNGAGKTTLMRTVSGTLYRHRGQVLGGSVTLAGTPLLDVPAAERVRLGVVQSPEGRRIFGRLSVEENLRVGGIRRSRAQVEAGLARVHDLFPILADRRTQAAGLLSGGEQQMLAIGRALLADPRILLLDEPMLGLAPKIIEQLADLLRRLRDEGLTILLVEQNAAVALAVADHAYVLSGGEVALSGPAAELRHDERVQQLYVGGAIEDAGMATSPVDRGEQ